MYMWQTTYRCMSATRPLKRQNISRCMEFVCKIPFSWKIFTANWCVLGNSKISIIIKQSPIKHLNDTTKQHFNRAVWSECRETCAKWITGKDYNLNKVKRNNTWQLITGHSTSRFETKIFITDWLEKKKYQSVWLSWK